jgi:hypothetical protein
MEIPLRPGEPRTTRRPLSALSSLTITSDTPGFNARIKAGSSTAGPFRQVSGSQTVGSSTTFSLNVPSPERYYLIWITYLASGGYADINEVTAKG